MEQNWLQGQRILMLEPRRLAARAAARYMARSLGEEVGQTVGYRVRMDSRVSAATRIEVVTEGILTRRLQQDPELEGTGLLIFDEYHERSLQADLGLALCLDVRAALREDLRLLVMSATLDVQALQGLLGDASLVEARGRSFPVQTLYDAGPGNEAAPAAALRGVRRALAEGSGDILVFLPGVGEIRRAEALLTERLGQGDIQICPLYGDLDAKTQEQAIQPDPQGRRRVVLATSIAETSLTIEGVSRVVDTGWNRSPSFDPNTGLTRLVTARVSQAAAHQRSGRAGRLGPGTCYRMWSESLTLNPQAEAEILQADLAPLVLELALWGVNDPSALNWLNPPPLGAVSQATKLLVALEALDENRRITALGRRMAVLPLHPRLSHMLLWAADTGHLTVAADLAAVLSERDIFRYRPGEPRSRDLEQRLDALAEWRKRKGHSRAYPLDAGASRRCDQVSRQLRSLLKGQSSKQDRRISLGALVALAYPDRLARRRAVKSGTYLLANGRGAVLDLDEPLLTQEYLAVAAMDAGERNGRIFLAASVQREELERLFAERMEAVESVRWDPQRKAVEAWRELRLGALVLDRVRLTKPDTAQVLPVLLDGIRREGLDRLPWDERARGLLARLQCLREWDREGAWPDVSDASLADTLDEWLGPWLDGLSALEQVSRLNLADILRNGLTWEARQRLDELAPEQIQVPAGGRRALRYTAGESPVLAVRLQEMFGQRDTPRICRGQVPVTLHLLSPARRPLQITQDLGGFWDRTYAEVRKEMKGRYPKHYWPEDPREAVATSRVRPRK